MAGDGLIRDETGAQRLVGYVLDVGQPDRRARCTLDVDDRHLNRHGVLHGGVIAMLLDNASGATASLTVDSSGRRPFLTISFHVDYLAPVPVGRVTATGMLRGGGRSTLFIDGELRDEGGALLAKSSGVFRRVAGIGPAGDA